MPFVVITKKVISTVADIQSTRPDDYKTFWQKSSAVCSRKASSTTSTIATPSSKASSFESTNSDEALTTLADHVGRMVSGQKSIYYMTGESRKQIETRRIWEAFRAKGISSAAPATRSMRCGRRRGIEFEDKSFVSIAKGCGGPRRTRRRQVRIRGREGQDAAEYGDLLTWLGEALSDDVTEARISHRLTESAACLVGDTFSMSPQLEKLYRASGQDVPKTKRALEINPDHALVKGLNEGVRGVGRSLRTEPTAQLIYGCRAVLAEGGDLPDPARFAKLLAATLTAAITT